MFKFFGTLICCFLLISCEKSISFKTRQAIPSMVVEATIENDQPPIVILSRSLDFFSTISIEALNASFIRNAIVEISNGVKTHQLKEYRVLSGSGHIFYFYSVDSTNLSTAFFGELGKSYALSIKSDNQLYTAETTIPLLAKTIDSLWWEQAPDNPDTNKVVLMTRASDPPGYGNYIRYFTKTNNEPFFPGLNSVFDDQIIDGKTYSISIERGVNRNSDIDFETYSFFDRGDTVTVKLCNIDKETFEFWRTMEYSYSSIGNPFSSPTKVLGNINGALGYFGGYAAQYKTIAIPE